MTDLSATATDTFSNLSLPETLQESKREPTPEHIRENLHIDTTFEKMINDRSVRLPKSHSCAKHRRLLFYTDNELVRQTLEKRSRWKFNPDPMRQNDFIFRVNKSILDTMICPRIMHHAIWDINGKYRQFAVLKAANYQHIPPTHLTLADYDENEAETNQGDRWFYKLDFSSCGLGVFLCPDRDSIEECIAIHKVQYVLQKQVSPLLYTGNRYAKGTVVGRKFDLRVYVLIDMQNNVYLYNDFLCRICTKDYDSLSKDNKVQLTNIAQGAGMIPLSKWDSNNMSGPEIFQCVKSAVTDLAPILKRCHRENIHRKFTFLGCDYIIDDTKKAKLLEINNAPSLGHNKTYKEIVYLQTRVISDFAREFLEPVLMGTRNTHKGNWVLV